MTPGTAEPASSTGTRAGGPIAAPPDRETRIRIRLTAFTLAVAATGVAAVLLWAPWPGRNNLAYADLLPVRGAGWAGAMVDAVATGTAAVMLGLTVCALVRGRGAAWARIGALIGVIGGIGSAAGLAAMGVLVWYATDQTALPAERGTALLNHVDAESGHVAVLLVPGFLLFTLAVLMFAVALWRAGTTPRWLPPALVVLSLGAFVIPPGRALDAAQAALYLLFAAIAVRGWRSAAPETANRRRS